MRLLIAPSAARALQDLPHPHGAELLAHLLEVASNPAGHHRWMRRLIDVSYIGARVCHVQWHGLCRFDYPGGVVIVDEVLSERQADDRAILEAAEAREHELGKEVARASHLPGEDLLRVLGGL